MGISWLHKYRRHQFQSNANIDDGSCIIPLISNFDGIERQYLLYLPENLPNNAPLVFVLHGYTENAQGIMEYSGMNEVAELKWICSMLPSRNNRSI